MSRFAFPAPIALLAHLEDCIVYHELAITAHEIARSRVLGHRRRDGDFLVATEQSITRETIEIRRLRSALHDLKEPTSEA